MGTNRRQYHGGCVDSDIVRSADAVNATLNAPSAPTPIENDPNLIAETPIPDVPASIRADILAEVTAAIADAQGATSSGGQ